MSIIARQGRILLMTAVLAIGVVCVSECGGSSGGDKGKLEEYEKKKSVSEAEAAKKEAEQRLEKISDYFTDSRNGQKYRIVKIGGKTWTAQNLNYQTGRSWCYGGDNSNCRIYGRLYDWNTAKAVCPAGWRLPSRPEWDDLVQAAGGKRESDDNGFIYWSGAGKRLKSAYGWDYDGERNGNGTDDFGFSALPGGSRSSDGSFYHAGKYGYWWTAAEGGGGNAYSRGMGYGGDYVDGYAYGRNGGFSVRCVAD